MEPGHDLLLLESADDVDACTELCYDLRDTARWASRLAQVSESSSIMCGMVSCLEVKCVESHQAPTIRV